MYQSGQAAFDYQLDRHCSKTGVGLGRKFVKFDYQLDRHYSKTTFVPMYTALCLITS